MLPTDLREAHVPGRRAVEPNRTAWTRAILAAVERGSTRRCLWMPCPVAIAAPSPTAAHGFSIDLMVELIDAGLAIGESERMVAGNYRDERTRVRITEAGRRALGE